MWLVVGQAHRSMLCWRSNLPDSFVDVVLNSPEANGITVQEDVASPPIAIARLPNRAHVADRVPPLGTINELKLTRRSKAIVLSLASRLFNKNTRNMRVSQEA